MDIEINNIILFQGIRLLIPFFYMGKITMNKKYITSIGYTEMRKKIEKLKLEYRECLIEMQEVKENCLSSDDTSELNQYRLMLESLNDKIDELSDLIDTSTVIDINSITTDRVVFGSLVEIENLDTGEEVTYRLVSSFESNPKEGMVSIQSPIGKALVGCVEGDTASYRTPSGESSEYEILSIGK